MTYPGTKSRAERAVEFTAALCFGSAVAIAIFQLIPLAAGWAAVAALAGGVAAGAAALALMALGAPNDFALPALDPGAIEDQVDELLLDQPITAVGSRVASPIVGGPAEKLARIGAFADSGEPILRRAERLEAARLDASAALHAALAEIRHSLGRA